MGCFPSKPKAVDPPPREPPHVPLRTRPQDSSTRHLQNLQTPLPHDPQGSTLLDVPRRPPQDTLRARPHDPPTVPPQDTPRQPLPDAPNSPTPTPDPVSEPSPPPPYSVLPLQDPQPMPSTLDSQTLSIQNPQTPTGRHILTTPPSDRSPPLTIPSTPPTVTDPPQLLGSSTAYPPVDVTELRSTSPSQTLNPTTNSSTLAISPPQAPVNLARDQHEQRVGQALKATLHRMRTTLRRAPSSVPRVQNFVKMNLDVVDLIEMSSKEHELQDFHDLMEEINPQFVALIDRFSIPEDLHRKIDSIARYLLNVIYPHSSLVLTFA
ncbi:hypothetical protein ARMGADRAFT_731228 [Armillaria gallica]|uniref:Uncharacterized protein n=1 Tax=Armillaria gallica TaxID=47427 RepID=A0A2H3CTX1_ARMGA|nr:hypothetical protein ARMGADRAFT_731228 [Armillaria gallica]